MSRTPKLFPSDEVVRNKGEEVRAVMCMRVGGLCLLGKWSVIGSCWLGLDVYEAVEKTRWSGRGERDGVMQKGRAGERARVRMKPEKELRQRTMSKKCGGAKGMEDEREASHLARDTGLYTSTGFGKGGLGIGSVSLRHE
jgi:hypothetical protein